LLKKFIVSVLCISHLLASPALAQGVFSDALNQIDAIESPKLSVKLAAPTTNTVNKILSENNPLFNAPAIFSEDSIVSPVYDENGMVSTGSDIATNIAVEVLNRGGNAIDAAIATAFTMSVTMPRAGNIGGGGFMLVHHAKTKETRAIDYREMAPKAATADMYLDQNGNVDKNLARHSFLSAGVPGTVKGMELAYRLYASMDWEELLQPAIHLADQGFVVDKPLSNSLKKGRKHLEKSLESTAVFYKKDGYYEAGEMLKQADLARTLKIISQEGADAFYTGDIADKIVQSMEVHGGIITKEDLANYKALLREPVSGYYKGYKVVSMPPPSSGGVHLIQMLKILDNFDLSAWGFGSAKTIHAMAEVMRLAYADRSKYLGDPDFVSVPVRSIMSDLYADRLSKSISMGSATPSELIEPAKFMPKESPQTTHFTIVDKWGNVVTNTYTLNFSYGSGHMVAGTGMLLNNEMDDFAAKVGAKNAYGLIGGAYNKIEPEKRPLSSMTPTIVFDKKGSFYMSLGSPGGSRIITTVLQVILNVIDHKMNIAEAVTAARMHHQWYPDEIRVEKGFSPDTIALLQAKGHVISQQSPMGAVMAVMKTENGYAGFSDTRRGSSLAKGGASPHEIDASQNFNPLLLELIEEQVVELNVQKAVKAKVKVKAVEEEAAPLDQVNKQPEPVKLKENTDKKRIISTPFKAMMTPISEKADIKNSPL
jgi:gamma-glutamyltranspeptidase/glutathione hydrolase